MGIVGEYIGDISSYCQPQQDNDYNYYWFVRADVVMYRQQDSRINEVLSRFERLFTEGLYIKGNKIFFTLDGAKYYVYGLSHFSSEWEGITDLLAELSKLADNVAYLYGALD